jgi:hypothetical protein
MPNSTREWARRELERAADLIEWLGTHLNRVEERYRPEHPDIADPCLLAMQSAATLQEYILGIRAKI